LLARSAHGLRVERITFHHINASLAQPLRLLSIADQGGDMGSALQQRVANSVAKTATGAQ
jgi:hypothetical protein